MLILVWTTLSAPLVQTYIYLFALGLNVYRRRETANINTVRRVRTLGKKIHSIDTLVFLYFSAHR